MTVVKPDDPHRTFKVDGGGDAALIGPVEDILRVLIDPRVIAAYQIMIEDDYPEDSAAKLVLAAEQAGKDPVAFANHFVGLRKFARTLK